MPHCVCRNGWIQEAASCYYIPENSLTTANAAFKFCKDRGAFLATPYDIVTALWLQEYAKKNYKESRYENILFVGMKCEDRKCKWVDSPGLNETNEIELVKNENLKLQHQIEILKAEKRESDLKHQNEILKAEKRESDLKAEKRESDLKHQIEIFLLKAEKRESDFKHQIEILKLN